MITQTGFSRVHGAAFGALVAISLCNCAPNTTLDSNTAASIHTIALAGFDRPVRYSILSSSIDRDSTYVQRLDGELQQLGLRIGPELRTALANALSRQGYVIGDSTAKADAVLQPKRLLAFYDGGIFDSSFTPDVTVEIEMTDRRTGEVVFAKRFSYIDSGSPVGVTVVRPDPRFSFPSDDALLADPGRAAEGLRAAEPLLANAIAEAMARR